MNIYTAKLGNLLYKLWPAVYRPTYSLYKRWSDREERLLLANMVRPGMTVLDVGANIGIYTSFLADLVGSSGRVIAFEPEPKNFALLERALAGLPQVTMVHAAVANRSGTLRLYVADDLNVDHHSYDEGEGRRSVEVPAVAMDGYIGPGQRVDVIKMDIQGAEMSALLGAKRVLTENPSIELLFEYWPFGLMRAGVQPRQVPEFLSELGFEMDIVGDPTKQLSEIGSSPDDYCNVCARRQFVAFDR